MPVVVVGSVALDTVRTPKESITRGLGGSAVHFANAASLLEKVKLVGVVGKDYPEEGIQFLTEKGVDLEGLERTDGKTFHWEGYYEGDMGVAHTVNTELNVLGEFDPKIPASYKDEKFLFLANIVPDLQIKVLEEMGDLELSVMDTMNFWIESQKDRVIEVLKRVDIALLNDQEARDLSGESSIVKAGKALLQHGVKYVVIKKGESGAVVVGHDDYFVTPAYPVENVVDPTGAGDSFAGGLVSYIAHTGKLTSDTLRKAMVYATAVASFNVEAISVNALRKTTTKDVVARIRKLEDITRFGAITLEH